MGLLNIFRRGRVDRARLVEAVESLRLMQRARYDAAQTTDEFKNYWASADRLDADSANSKAVRHTLISRSRYEVANNEYSDGITQTYSTDLISVGPTLRMQTGSQAFNQMIERAWFEWTQAIRFREKLWCMAHAKCTDGEAFGVIRRNPGINHRIQLDVVLYEAEQCQTPYPPIREDGYIDGIKFDEFGNPLWYDFLKSHPGSANRLNLTMEAEQVPAEFVLHWFKMRRPGQHRGVPELASTLNLGAGARRMREATLAAAETAADLNVMLTTQLTPDSVTDPMAPFSSMPIQKRMMTAAPAGWEAHHFKSEHPTSTYKDFIRCLINGQARAKNMPFNKAACDSSSYNYASGRLDHQTYYAALDVDREDCNDRVLNPLFNQWLNMAILRFGWLGGDPAAVSASARYHIWDWPKHRVADVEAEANANRTKLQSGQIFPHRLAADAGLDFEDEIEAAAKSFGVEVDEMRKRMLDVLLPSPTQQSAPKSPAVDAAMNGLGGRINGHGVHHVN